MDDLKERNPQQLLEDAFRALYMHDSDEEALRVKAEQDLNAYQIEWCNWFQERFSFVSQYGGRIVLNLRDDFAVKFHHLDKCSVSVLNNSGGYSIEIHPPAPNTEQCMCLEHYMYDEGGNKLLKLTLPEITMHISKGLAKSNADHKQLHETD